MPDDAPSQRDLARRLLAYEAEGSSDPLRMADAVDQVCRKLHQQLERIVGELGVRLMLRRALVLTRRKFAFISADPAPGNCEQMEGLQHSLAEQDPAMAAEAVTFLVTNLLAVLVGLLG